MPHRPQTTIQHRQLPRHPVPIETSSTHIPPDTRQPPRHLKHRKPLSTTTQPRHLPKIRQTIRPENARTTATISRQMNKAAQINTLRRIRRQCPYLATEGGLGYMCDRGNTTSNGVRYITGGTDRQQMRRHCTLLCQDILRKAKNMGISITISNNRLLTI